MNSHKINPIKACLLAGALAGLCLATSVSAGNSPAPGGSSAFGKTLAQWQDVYWRWTYGGLTVPTDANGNAVVNGNVVLMPLPNAPGDGTPGHLNVTLNSGCCRYGTCWATAIATGRQTIRWWTSACFKHSTSPCRLTA